MVIRMERAVNEPHVLEPHRATGVGDIAVANDDVFHVFAIKAYGSVAADDDEISKLAAFRLWIAELF